MFLSKKNLVFLCIIFLLLSFLVKNAPLKRNYSDAPDGWSGGGKGAGLGSIISDFSILSTQLYLKSNDYIRILYYGSLGYVDKDSVTLSDKENNFTEVVKGIIGEPDFSSLLPESRATKVSKKVLNIANNDGYKFIDKVFLNTGSPVLLDVDKNIYSWKPDATLGEEMDPYWGEIQKSQNYTCKVGTFPIKSYTELVSEANYTATATVNLFKNKDRSKISNLINNFTMTKNSQPGRVIINIFINYLNDNDLEVNKRDEILFNFINNLFDLSIVTFQEKYYYNIAHFIQLSTVPTMQSWLQTRPPFPSEFGAYGNLLSLYINKYGEGKNIRLDIPGSLVANISTRVYADSDSFLNEFTNSAILNGNDYKFSIITGKTLGECIYNEYKYKKI